MIFQPFWLILVFNSAVTIQVLPLKFKKNTLNYSDSTVKNNHENKMIIRGPKRGKRKKNKQKRSSNIQHPTSNIQRPASTCWFEPVGPSGAGRRKSPSQRRIRRESRGIQRKETKEDGWKRESVSPPAVLHIQVGHIPCRTWTRQLLLTNDKQTKAAEALTCLSTWHLSVEFVYSRETWNIQRRPIYTWRVNQLCVSAPSPTKFPFHCI